MPREAGDPEIESTLVAQTTLLVPEQCCSVSTATLCVPCSGPHGSNRQCFSTTSSHVSYLPSLQSSFSSFSTTPFQIDAAAAPKPVHPEAVTLCKESSVFPIPISDFKQHCSCAVQPLRLIRAILKPARSATNHTKPLKFSNLIHFRLNTAPCCAAAASSRVRPPARPERHAADAHQADNHPAGDAAPATTAGGGVPAEDAAREAHPVAHPAPAGAGDGRHSRRRHLPGNRL